MKRLLILFSVSVIALAVLVIPGMAFPTVTEAQSPEVAPDDNVAPDKIDKPTVRLRANGKLGVNWEPVAGATRHMIQIQRPDGSNNIFRGRNHRSVPPSYGFIRAKYITRGVPHRARVKALNSADIQGEWSDWSEYTLTPDKIDKPAVWIRANGWLGVDWEPVAGATKYMIEIRRPDGSSNTFSAGAKHRRVQPSYGFITGIIPGVQYQVRVKALNLANIEGEWSEWSDSVQRDLPVISK